MSDTSIEWTNRVWNPITGCTKISQGCKHCYAETIANRFWGGRKFTDIICHDDRLDIPLRWKKPARIFVNSMSDLFHPSVPDSFIAAVWMRMISTPQHTYQILTKRPERMSKLVPELFRDAFTGRKVVQKNIWLGVSVENQEAADERIPFLVKTPAAVRFISCEPLLEPVNLWSAIEPDEDAWDEVNAEDDDPEPEELEEECEMECDWVNYGHDLVPNPEYRDWMISRTNRARWLTFKSLIDWVIVGGESGAGARPMDLAWARGIHNQCHNWNACSPAIIPFFMKQLGGWPDKRHQLEQFPEDLRVREYPRE
jgi:protein gp37